MAKRIFDVAAVCCVCAGDPVDLTRGRCCIGRGVQVFYQPAANEVHSADNWWRSEQGLMAVSNELIKGGFYWWRYGVGPWGC